MAKAKKLPSGNWRCRIYCDAIKKTEVVYRIHQKRS